jgi:hypothetical protein
MLIHLTKDIKFLIKLSFNTPKATRDLDALLTTLSNTTIIELKEMHRQYHYTIIVFSFLSMAGQIEASN